MIQTRCPECYSILAIKPEELACEVECYNCYEIFFAESYAPNRPKKRRAPTPTRRQLQLDSGHSDDRSVRDAFRDIKTHARGLYWTGIGGLVMSPIIGMVCCGVGGKVANKPNGHGDVIGIVGAALTFGGLVYFGILTVAAKKAVDEMSTTWAYTSVALGIGTLVCFSPLLPVTWAGVPFGILLFLALRRFAARRRDDD